MMASPPDTHKLPLRPRRVRQSDVARQAGVHPSTVSLALRPETRHMISTDQTQRIRQVAQDLGYSPDTIAVSMRTGRSRLIGMMLHDMSDPVYPTIAKGVESAVRDHGYMLMTGNTGYDQTAEADLLNAFSSRRVDGIILATTRLDDPVVDRCVASGMPTVTVFRRPRKNTIPAVLNDCKVGMVQLVDTVQDYGHQRLAFLSAPIDISSGKDRHDGVMQSLRPGTTCHVEFLAELTAEAGYLGARKLLAQGRPADVILCVNDLVAIGAYRALKEAGLRCPEDVSVTGYNGMPFCDILDPPLTTVNIQLFEMGMLAGRALIDLIEAHKVPATATCLRPKLVLRKSLIKRV